MNPHEKKVHKTADFCAGCLALAVVVLLLALVALILIGGIYVGIKVVAGWLGITVSVLVVALAAICLGVSLILCLTAALGEAIKNRRKE